MSTLTEQITGTGTGPTKQLEAALHAHFIKPEDRTSLAGAGAIFLTEVTAPGSNRRADAVHIGLWQNRGAGRIDVCELKTSRSDFLRELNAPAKAEAWWPYSTAFWLVVPHVSIAKPEDMPPGWGLMVPSGRGRRFKVLVKPAEREPRIDIPLLLTLLKNTETTRTNDLRMLQDKMWSQQRESEKKLRRELAGSADPDIKRRLDLLDSLERRLGRPLSSYEWETDAITPAAAARVLATYAAGEAALAHAQEELRRQATGLTRRTQTTSGAAPPTLSPRRRSRTAGTCTATP